MLSHPKYYQSQILSSANTIKVESVAKANTATKGISAKETELKESRRQRIDSYRHKCDLVRDELTKSIIL